MFLRRTDVIIIGSGFAGTLLGWILAKQGRSVTILDKARHPRFAIGESTTPTADFLLAHLADRWELNELVPLVNYGRWVREYPSLMRGLKRGFAYYRHEVGRRHRDSLDDRGSMLVAASASDEWSDTQWLRSDVDHFFARNAVAAGCRIDEECRMTFARFDSIDGEWTLRFDRKDGSQGEVRARFLVDSTGGTDFGETYLSNAEQSLSMRTETGAMFGHFSAVGSMQPHSDFFLEDTENYFHPDASAQHQVTEEGWYWMIRFDHGCTSVGLVQPTCKWPVGLAPRNAMDYWQSQLARYPTIRSMMEHSVLEAPANGLRYQPRINRKLKYASGPGWVALPTTVGFVDPLHSTGIAHALSGVLRVADILLDTKLSSEKIQSYSNAVSREIDWIDTLVAGCYLGLPSFQRFLAYSCFYFVSAIAFEETLVRDPGHWNEGYMLSRCNALHDRVEPIYVQLLNGHLISDRDCHEAIRRAIEPWNRIGLLEPSRGYRFAHTAPPKYLLPQLG